LLPLPVGEDTTVVSLVSPVVCIDDGAYSSELEPPDWLTPVILLAKDSSKFFILAAKRTK
jgi:hypothetical protein